MTAMRGYKSATALRAEAYRLAMNYARERAKDGDPEGAGVIRDLATDIRAIPIREPAR